uniref:Histidine phosphatase family protein n=1 Tax=Haemonchus placei TaxID=6290 RepID=A0A0N4X555_HAEPC
LVLGHNSALHVFLARIRSRMGRICEHSFYQSTPPHREIQFVLVFYLYDRVVGEFHTPIAFH